MVKRLLLNTCACALAALAIVMPANTQDLQLKIFRLRSNDTKRIYSAVEPMKSEQGKITFDEATQNIIVYDTQEAIERVQRIIGELDIPAREVRVEVTTIASTQQAMHTLGITSLHTVVPGSKFLGILGSAGNGERIEKIYAHSQITTLENQKASIQLTQDVVVGEEITVYPDFATATPLRSPIGQTLEVIAIVNPDNTITLNVEPSLRTMSRGGIQEGSLSTHVTVNEGDAVVIGMCDMKRSTTTTSRSENSEDKKLVTFLSAKILK